MNARDWTRESLGSLDELWEIMLSALGFLIPLLKEVNATRAPASTKSTGPNFENETVFVVS